MAAAAVVVNISFFQSRYGCHDVDVKFQRRYDDVTADYASALREGHGIGPAGVYQVRM